MGCLSRDSRARLEMSPHPEVRGRRSRPSLEGWPQTLSLPPIFRDALLRNAPQDEGRCRLHYPRARTIADAPSTPWERASQKAQRDGWARGPNPSPNRVR